MDAASIVLLGTPAVVWLATLVARTITEKLKGGVTLVVVPALTVVATLITQAVGVQVPFWAQLLSGFGSVFIAEVIKAVKS